MTTVEKVAFAMLLLAFLMIAIMVFLPSQDDDIDNDNY